MVKSGRNILRAGWITVLLLVVSIWGAFAQGVGNNFVPGEMIVSFPVSIPRATVDTILNGVGARVVHAFGTVDFERKWNVFYVRSTNPKLSKVETWTAVDKLKTDPRVKYAGPNFLLQRDQAAPSVTPNDPMVGQQWALPMMRVPNAWTLEKGKSNVVVAIIDSEIDIDHPDLKDRIVRGDPNLEPLNATNPAAFTNDPRGQLGDEHGTHVAGISIATTNNSTGIAGIAWENAKLLPIKVDLTGLQGAEASAIAAWQELLRRATASTQYRFVANCSFNLGDSTTDSLPAPGSDPACDALLNVAKGGVIMVMSGGNRGSVGDTNPPRRIARMAAAHNNIFSVAAVNRNGTRANYSSFRPTNTIAAPGGELAALEDPNGILSTWPLFTGQQYHFEQGTSMAAPQVTGVIALLLSIPSVVTTDVKNVLTTTATRVPGARLPSDEYGWGIVNAYAALLKVAVAVTITTPDGTGGKATGRPGTPLPIETLQPTIRVAVNLIIPKRFTLQVDGVTIPECETPGQDTPCYTVENVTTTTTDEDGNTVPYVWEAVIRNLQLPPGTHKITVTGVKPGNPDITVTDTRNFLVQPKVIGAGRSMISIPYYQAFGATESSPIMPEMYFGNDFRLARWIPDQERYAYYSSFGVRDPLASFTPPNVAPRREGDPAPSYPIGLGFWSDTESAKPILTRGAALTDRPFIIPLIGLGPRGEGHWVSWNMIGDPFPFDVPFNSILVDTSTGRISIQEAVTRGLILPNIFSYDGENGYTYRTLPDGALRAWQGHWIGVTSRENINLVVPPVTSQTRAAGVGAPDPVVGGWTLRLSAQARNLRDTFNFIGVSQKASDGYGLEDTPKPPLGAPYVNLGISHSDWGRSSGLYASDIRSANGAKSWTVTVDTDQTSTDVTVQWTGKGLPRGQRVTIKDEATGQVYDMRSRSSLTFNSGESAGQRRFTISANPRPNNQVTIKNVMVRQISRAAGTSQIGFTLTGDATYEVNVLNSAGGKVTRLSSRAAAAGDVNVVWNGKDASGRNVASGNYLVQIRATTPEGDSAKVIYPFAVVR